jgi:hypothetical protein
MEMNLRSIPKKKSSFDNMRFSEKHKKTLHKKVKLTKRKKS